MAKKLVIAEKPSVAGDITRALGGFTRKGDYYESSEYVVSSAVGHLLELAVPAEHDVKKGKWSFARLPVIPPHFELAPIEKNENRLNVLLRLLKRKDVTGIINACDAGREGELIFRYIVQYARTKKPIERLWLQSMTQGAIREGFAALRRDGELLPLADAAKSRSEADWLVGINGTRAMTAFNSKEGGFYLTTVGRVQTPTLAILVEREESIRAFKPRDYWEVHARFGVKAGEYAGRWFDPAFKKSDDAERKAERLWEGARAQAIAAACAGQSGVVTDETKPATQLSPLLFDLTSLQREANGRFGFSARTTLSLAQALYERHKVLTYPRTDSRALPEDYLGTVRKTLDMLGGLREYAPFAKSVSDAFRGAVNEITRAKPGDTLTMQYVGVSWSTGEEFDANWWVCYLNCDAESTGPTWSDVLDGLLEQAYARVDHPKPGIRHTFDQPADDGTIRAIVRAETWWWAESYSPVVEEDSDGPVWVRVTATPGPLTIDPGDGSGTFQCDGPGLPYNRNLSYYDQIPGEPRGACVHVYEQVADSVTATLSITCAIPALPGSSACSRQSA